MTSEIRSASPTGASRAFGQVEPENPFGEQGKTDRQAVEHHRCPDEGEKSLHIVESRRARDQAVQPGSNPRAALLGSPPGRQPWRDAREETGAL